MVFVHHDFHLVVVDELFHDLVDQQLQHGNVKKQLLDSPRLLKTKTQNILKKEKNF
jgi:hypothetical protein